MARHSKLFWLSGLAALLLATLVHLALTAAGPQRWDAWVHLLLYGWISCSIFAVNYHTTPVFSGRNFPKPAWLELHWLVWSLGVVLASSGLVWYSQLSYRLGLGLEWLGSWLFMANILQLLRSPKLRPSMPASPQQQQIDRLSTLATKTSGASLLLALSLILAREFGLIHARWLLSAEHLLTLGWMMLMIIGVGCHVLPRWSGQAPRNPGWLRVGLGLHHVGLLSIVLGLGFDLPALFALGASLVLCALCCCVWLLIPALATVTAKQANQLSIVQPRRIGPLTMWCIRAAVFYLAVGIGFGISFAFDRALGAQLRPIHVESNLAGFATILIYGMAYFMLPRFMGRPLGLAGVANWQVVLAISAVLLIDLGWAGLVAGVALARWLLVFGASLHGLAALLFSLSMLATIYQPAQVRRLAHKS
ncbi:hypothetical protein [Herpetosiphon giganteus]|uniref:hypothetical protein n=1 Tax=Herpetosiphon giganteus TaxID=2029754 RepID=UPI00195C836B|nr:hypothetical protein [Herpetosiphon giganteus]MBM7842606.1 hypothetical protein [Herpetosiphon giganteus]